MPLITAQSPSPRPSALGERASSPRLDGRVLVVDDSEAKRYLIAHALRLAGMEVHEVSTGHQALAAMEQRPDVVVLDVRLPDLSGFEVCRRLKADPATAAIPVLYVSALLQDGDLERQLFDDGADGYIPQPIEPKHLVAQTWALVRMRRAEQARMQEREVARAEREQLVLALARAEDRVRRLADSGVVGLITWDMDGTILDANDAFLGMLGYTREDLERGRLDWRALTPSEWAEVDSQELQALQERGIGRMVEKQYLHRDGSRVDVLLGGAMLEEDRQRGVSLVVDVTARREAERRSARLMEELRLSEQRLADIQGTTAAFAHALTPSEVANAVVAHGLRSLEAYAGAVCLLKDEALLVLSETGYVKEIVRAYQELPLTRRTPLTDAARTGEAVWVESPEVLEQRWPEMRGLLQEKSRSWAAIPLKDGERVVGVLGLSFASPRSFGPQERVHLEALCQLCAQALERARLYEEERLAKEEARRLTELEQQFLGVVSHDLRNPLQAISLAARTLQRAEQPSPEVLMRVAGRIAASADTMGRMVSDLLDFTRERLGGGVSLERTPSDMGVLCREVIDEFLLTHPTGNIRFESDEACPGVWDGGRMRQVVSNLLSNALRHARAGTAVQVRTRALPGEVEVSVTNEGEAIPEDLLPVLFEPFRRGIPKYRPAGSLGLGLFIVRRVVEGHAGRVEVTTGETGTTFTVRVPTA
ncbi:ATP-binding protein [Pyxidicoccus sp. 3LFB2]